MAKKGPMPSYATVDDYINAQSSEAQPILRELRDIIREAAPDCIEMKNYKVPSFTLVQGGKRDQQLMFAAYAKFVSFYPFQTTLDHFAEELKEFTLGKGTVQFSFDSEVPRELISRMVRYRREEVLNDWKG